jgi:DNA-binding FadR family transcriptional regulator
MQDFTISRPTLREAFRILESEGLITVRRGARGGARVQEPSADVVARYAGLVLQHRGATVADVLEALDSAEVDEAERFHEFNALLVELTDNQTLVLLTTMLEHISQAAALNYSRSPHQADDEVRLRRKAHRTREKLIELIHAGDAEGAEDLWRTHLTEAGRVLSESSGGTVVDLFG